MVNAIDRGAHLSSFCATQNLLSLTYNISLNWRNASELLPYDHVLRCSQHSTTDEDRKGNSDDEKMCARRFIVEMVGGRCRRAILSGQNDAICFKLEEWRSVGSIEKRDSF